MRQLALAGKSRTLMAEQIPDQWDQNQVLVVVVVFIEVGEMIKS